MIHNGQLSPHNTVRENQGLPGAAQMRNSIRSTKYLASLVLKVLSEMTAEPLNQLFFDSLLPLKKKKTTKKQKPGLLGNRETSLTSHSVFGQMTVYGHTFESIVI